MIMSVPIPIRFVVLLVGLVAITSCYVDSASSFMSLVSVSQPGYNNRSEANAVVLNGKLLVTGGYDYINANINYNDVWSSSDFGSSWVLLLANAPWQGRLNAAEGVFLSPPTSTTYGTSPNVYVAPPNTPLIVLVGGAEVPSARYSDVWVSPDGVQWAQATGSIGTTVYLSAVIACNHVLYSIGGVMGSLGSLPSNQVYRSTDAITWTYSIAPFTGRYSFAAAVTSSNTRIIIAGGKNLISPLNDVWISNVGVSNWTMLASAAPWAPRSGHGLLTVSGYLYLVAGLGSSTSSYYNDIWASPDDGASWIQVTASAGFTPRNIWDNLLADGRRLFVVGGQDINYLSNDTWFGYVA